jgi:hypothetical protein
MSQFIPTECPYPECDRTKPFRYQFRGAYTRKVDGRSVPRVQCLGCKRRFSAQTFRVDYRLKRPDLVVPIFELLTSKVTLRQMASMHQVNLKTIAHRLRLLGAQAKAVHEYICRTQDVKLGEKAPFVFDELETFEVSKIHGPLTVPVVMDGKTWFIVHAEVGTMAARRKLPDAPAREHQSNLVVERCLKRVKELVSGACTPHFVSDRKQSYVMLLRQIFPQYAHLRVSSKAPRVKHNPMFPINNLFAQMRDGLSRLVRPNWAHSKKRERLVDHLWIYVVYRNYVREITRDCLKDSSASALGILPRRLTVKEVLTLRGRIAL